MKKLSIEEKARCYDEAIEKFDVILNLNTVKESGTIFTDDVRKIFPELAESEDERIRKELLDYCKNKAEKYPNDPKYNNISAWIAWLEKQGEHANFLDKIQIGDKVTRNENGVLVNLSQLNRVAKPADKAEPKFEIGDWVIDKQDIVHQIANVIENVTYHTYGYDIVGGGYFNDNTEGVRLWTIQDAKDGDVLCTYECGKPKIIFILKGTPKKHYALGYHCFYNIMYSLFDSDSEKGCLAPNDEDVKPATKEQRDQLEKAMAEDGYEWDSEMKELKKIVQKNTGFNIGDEITVNGQVCKVVAVDKTAWSEEDEEIRRKCICAMRASACGFPEEEKFVEQVNNWLESLKDRVTPQPKQEWSEEDKRKIGDIRDAITLDDELEESYKEELYDFLKSLRPQKQWKPSEQDILLLERIFDGKSDPRDFQASLQGIIEQLKNLKGE